MLRASVALLLALAFALCSVNAQSGQNWAVLVAGSNGYYNYRHQSDIYHAYQILKKNGIPDSNIIVFHYDDIANNSQNPKKGTVINYPGGPNVYVNVPKDYTGNQVTPKNFLDVLLGKDMGSGKKTLKSGPNDNVFIYFSDHGGPQIIAFPNEMLNAKDLIDTLNTMYAQKKYKELVFYLEACESGSMFNNLLKTNTKIYATTASNPYVSSYACDYDNTYRTYLNDCYSINFLNNTEKNDVRTYTFKQQYDVIKAQTTESPVCVYGDTTIQPEVLGNFLAGKRVGFQAPKQTAPVNVVNHPDAVDSRNVKSVYLQRNVMAANDANERKYWMDQLEQHNADQRKSDTIWHSFAMKLGLENYSVKLNDAPDHCNSQKATDPVCMKAVVQTSERVCGKFDETSIKYTNYLRDACDAGITPAQVEKELTSICKFVETLKF